MRRQDENIGHGIERMDIPLVPYAQDPVRQAGGCGSLFYAGTFRPIADKHQPKRELGLHTGQESSGRNQIDHSLFPRESADTEDHSLPVLDPEFLAQRRGIRTAKKRASLDGIRQDYNAVPIHPS